MDAVELMTLQQELLRDAEVVESAAAAVGERLEGAGIAHEEAAGHQLCRLYNAIEQMALRVAKRFENAIDDPSRWHAELIRRVTLEIPGVRPALLPRDIEGPLADLRGFRHVFTHAYDLVLRRDRLKLLRGDGDRVAARLRTEVLRFVEAVAAMHAIPWPADGNGGRRPEA
ncbi:MAG: hypothetical protein KF833_03420 [Verrucomicrobiae bacterium]|nr:hypothetical protein [Verrucomicrobiae bacterium]